MTRLLLLRHGESTWNAEDRWQGWEDPPLSDAGRRQAEAAVAGLTGAGLEAVVCSDLARAHGTADILARALGLAVEVEPALRERDVGAWAGLTPAQIERGWPGALSEWRTRRLANPPGGETDASLTARALDVVQRLAARPEGSLLVVTHAGVVRAVERHLGRQPSRTPNLSGRWVLPHGAGLALGTTFPPAEADQEPTRQQSLVPEAGTAE